MKKIERVMLTVTQEYARKRKPAAYAQVVFDVEDKNAESIPAGTTAMICGWATSAEVDAAPLRDWGAKKGCKSDYLCHGIRANSL